jgi:predicted nuclease of predicted toxin-antitoxin system
MRILFDHGTPRSIARALGGHAVTTARTRGWERLTNGALLTVAEEAGFDLLVTTDKNIRDLQNLTGRKSAIIALGSPQLPIVRQHIQGIVQAVNAATPGSYCRAEMSTD